MVNVAPILLYFHHQKARFKDRYYKIKSDYSVCGTTLTKRFYCTSPINVIYIKTSSKMFQNQGL